MTKRSAILLVAGMCILGVSVIAAKHHVWRRDTVLKVSPCADTISVTGSPLETFADDSEGCFLRIASSSGHFSARNIEGSMGKNNCILDTTQKNLHIRRIYISWGPVSSHPKKKAQPESEQFFADICPGKTLYIKVDDSTHLITVTCPFDFSKFTCIDSKANPIRCGGTCPENETCSMIPKEPPPLPQAPDLTDEGKRP